jgi:fibronectin-binding autotransporter adhesin
MAVYQGESGSWVAGVNLFTGKSSVDVTSGFGNGNISTDSDGIGLTATWYGNQGFYTDIQLQYARFKSDLSSDVFGSLGSKISGSGRLASIEMGQAFSLENGVTLTPQAQLTWSKAEFDRFTGPNSETVSVGDAESLKLRLGVAAEQSWNFENGEQARLYGIANVIYEARGQTSVMVDGAVLTTSTPRFVGELGLGGSYDWKTSRDGTTSLYGEITASRALSGGKLRGIAGTIGLRAEW